MFKQRFSLFHFFLLIRERVSANLDEQTGGPHLSPILLFLRHYATMARVVGDLQRP